MFTSKGGVLNKLDCYQRFSNSIRHFAKYGRLNTAVVLTVIWRKYFRKYCSKYCQIFSKRSNPSVVSLHCQCKYWNYHFPTFRYVAKFKNTTTIRSDSPFCKKHSVFHTNTPPNSLASSWRWIHLRWISNFMTLLGKTSHQWNKIWNPFGFFMKVIRLLLWTV